MNKGYSWILLLLVFYADLDAQTWEDRAPVPGVTVQTSAGSFFAGPHPAGAAAVAKDASGIERIYIIGGFGAFILNRPSPIIAYNPQSDIWQTNLPELPLNRYHLAAATVRSMPLTDPKELIYVTGGRKDGSDINVVARVDQYDPVNQKWSQKSDMPAPRMRHGMTHGGNGKLYVFGGSVGSQAVSQYRDTVFEYTPLSDTWTTKAPMPVPLNVVSATTGCDSLIFIVSSGNKRVDAYDWKNDQWNNAMTIPDLPFQVSKPAITTGSNGRLYVMGLSGGPAALEYDPVSGTWTSLPGYSPRDDAVAATVGNWVFALGGGEKLDFEAAIEANQCYGPLVCGCEFDAEAYTVSGSETWTPWSNPFVGTIAMGSVKIRGELRIPSGSTLTVETLAIEFSEEGRVIVEPGGKLILDRGKLTSLVECGNMWGGVSVLGDRNAPQDPSIQGFLQLKNNALIENADEAITLAGEVNGGIDFSSIGGIVRARDSIFRNNGRVAQFLSYGSSGNINSISSFERCIFETTRPLNDPTKTSYYFVTMWDIDGVEFVDNIFRNTAQIGSTPARGGGIKAADAIFDVGPDNRFEGLDKGIELHRAQALSSGTNRIEDNTFFGCQTGIEIVGDGDGYEILNNHFSQSFAPPPALDYVEGIDSDKRTAGILLEGAKRFNVVSNVVEEHTYGIWIYNSSQAGDWGSNVFDNQLQSCIRGLETRDLNENLLVKCNTFRNGKGWTVSHWFNDGTMMDQGSCGNLTAPAGNIFWEPPQSEDITSSGNTFGYTHHEDVCIPGFPCPVPPNTLMEPLTNTGVVKTLCNGLFPDAGACDVIITNDPSRLRRPVVELIRAENWEEARRTLDELDEEESVSYYTVLIDVLSNGRNLFQLNSEEKTVLRTVASSTTDVGFNAKGLLGFFYDESFPLPQITREELEAALDTLGIEPIQVHWRDLEYVPIRGARLQVSEELLRVELSVDRDAGMAVELEGAQSYQLHLRPVEFSLADAAMTITGLGWDGEARRQLGQVSMGKRSDEIAIYADYSPLGSGRVRVEVWSDGQQMGGIETFTDGVMGTVGEAAVLAGWEMHVDESVEQVLNWEGEVAFTTLSGEVLEGDQIRLRAVGPVQNVTGLAQAGMTATGFAELLVVEGRKVETRELGVIQGTLECPAELRTGSIVEMLLRMDLSEVETALGGYEATANWDPSLLRYIGIEGGEFGNLQVGEAQLDSGRVQFNSFDATGETEVAELARLRFEVVGEVGALGILQVAFTEVVSTAGASFRDLGTLVEMDPCRFRVVSVGLGDVDGNGRLTVRDALIVATVVADPEIALPEGANLALGDVDGNGRLTIRDALMIATFAVDPDNANLPEGIGAKVVPLALSDLEEGERVKLVLRPATDTRAWEAVLRWNADELGLVGLSREPAGVHRASGELILADVNTSGLEPVEVELAARQAVSLAQLERRLEAYTGDFGAGLVELEVERVPRTFRLYANRPNPFNPETSIRYALPQAEQVELRIYNLQGQLVRTLVSARQAVGVHEVRWNGRDEQGRMVSSGVYLYRLEAGNFEQTRRMLLLK